MESLITHLIQAAFLVFFGIIAVIVSRVKPDVPVQEITYLPPEPMPEPVATETNREKLYRVSKSLLGQDVSPDDLAPDELACVDSLNHVYEKAFGEPIKRGLVSTIELYKIMLNDSRFRGIGEVEVLPGDIAIAVSVQTSTSIKHGHVGCVGEFDVMNNDSTDGIWKADYTLAAWKKYFWDTLHFPPHYFRVVG